MTKRNIVLLLGPGTGVGLFIGSLPVCPANPGAQPEFAHPRRPAPTLAPTPTAAPTARPAVGAPNMAEWMVSPHNDTHRRSLQALGYHGR